MGRLFKLLVLVAFGGGLLLLGSYLGSRATVGKLLGPNPPPMGSRTIKFLSRTSELRDRPLAWVYVFRGTGVPGAEQVKVYVSPTGRLLATRPENLDQRLEAYERTRLP